MTFEDLFETATGRTPYPYQVRWATGDALPSVVSVPTGLGKTSGAILSWVWRRRFAAESVRTATPRRLVYCLPMRVLVEQTHHEALRWLEALHLRLDDADGSPAGAERPSGIRVHLAMGGENDNDWDLHPEGDALLVGTQDMLLSAALGRGYATSRFRWPLQYGLLNTDTVWILDEIQLMGSGLATTTQLQSFRRLLRAPLAPRSTWMSATLRPEWLETVDFAPAVDGPGALALESDDLAIPDVAKRLAAVKRLTRIDDRTSAKVPKLAKQIADTHVPGTLTLVVVNTVRRAMQVFDETAKRAKAVETVLVHSRFRPPDRGRAIERLTAPLLKSGRIAVCTQVVEAGVDISARTLFTDLAPWPSLVQRFGRCNRRGEFADAAVIVMDVGKSTAPYVPEELEAAVGKLDALEDAAPRHLPPVEGVAESLHVIRRKDIIDLFDTTPDLAGADIDVSRFIRETDEHDVQVFWRAFDGVEPEKEPAPTRDELCSVPVGEIDPKSREVWQWDHLERGWKKAQTVLPGRTLLLNAKGGGYSADRGWTGDSKELVPPVETGRKSTPEANGDDPWTQSEWQTLAAHTEAVVERVERILSAMGPAVADVGDAVRVAARWHDVGKAHPVFQQATGTPPEPGIWAKAPAMGPYERRGFRHELVSALVMLDQGLPDLAAYLAAAHHGKVRLSIRSLPREVVPGEGRRFARGAWDGDEIPSADLGGGLRSRTTSLDLSYMEIGMGPRGPSWLERMLTLRDTLGPFTLAFLEALLRAADRSASAGVP